MLFRSVPVIVVFPTPVPVASPFVGFVSLTPTTALLPEVQFTSFVQSCVVPSLKLQVADSCTVVPLGRMEVGGVTTIDAKVAGVTVTVAEPWTPLKVAKAVVFPTATPLTSPLVRRVSCLLG